MEHEIKFDCVHFRGDIPCWIHKQFGNCCEECTFYAPIQKRILIIKLGALGDVLRTTPILRRLVEVYPQTEIWWLTRYPEAVPSRVDRILPFNLESMLQIQATPFEAVFNLDKDYESCALLKLVNAHRKEGFCLITGKTYPMNSAAHHKYSTGLYDDVNKDNRLTYQQEIFEICGFPFKGEEYILDCDVRYKWDELNLNPHKKVIGLNTGCGKRWPTRLWKTDYWIELAGRLKSDDHEVILLGGEDEHEVNRQIYEKVSVKYPGYFPFKKFVSLVDKCDLVVSAVTTGMHVAIGLRKKVVVFNNIFNRHEFELYGRGEIIEPTKECQCFFCQKCHADEHCMDTLYPQDVMSAIKRQLKK